jgi:hypothetical protein
MYDPTKTGVVMKYSK